MATTGRKIQRNISGKRPTFGDLELDYPGNHPLAGLVQKTKAHWAEHRPKMTAEMKAAGTFDELAEKAAKETINAVIHFVKQAGGDPDDVRDATLWQAWEMLREDRCFLRSELDDEEDREEEKELFAEEDDDDEQSWPSEGDTDVKPDSNGQGLLF